MLKHADENENGIQEVKLESPEYYESLSKNVAWYHKLLLNKWLKVSIVLFILAVVTPTLMFYFMVEMKYIKATVSDGHSIGTCSHDSLNRMQCGPPDITIKECEIHCCYDKSTSSCFHRIPSRYSYISESHSWFSFKRLRSTMGGTILKKNDETSMTMKNRQKYTPFRDVESVPQLEFKIQDVSTTYTKFVLYDVQTNFTLKENLITDKMFYTTLYYPEFYFEIYSSNENITRPLLSTARGPLIAGDGIWEWSFYLSDDYLFGLDQVVLKRNTSKIFYNNGNDSAAVPFIMAHKNGSFHAIYIEQHGPMVFNITPAGIVNVKSFTGGNWFVHFFYGASPADVIKDFRKNVGQQQMSLPYWALGAHFCRTQLRNYDYIKFMNDAEKAQMPYDSDCVDDELFKFANINNTEGLEEIGELFSNNSKHFMPSIRPQVSFNDKTGMNVTTSGMMIMDPYLDEEYKGMLFGSTVVYPDYSMDATKQWFNDIWPLATFFSSVVLKDNSPENDLDSSDCNVDLPYVTEAINTTLCKSIPWNARNPDENIQHMHSHNLYGSNHARAIKDILDSSPLTHETFIMSSSASTGDGIGHHLQNVITSWDGMKSTFKKLVANSMAGVYVQSSPVCGDSPDVSNFELLCIKWYLASITVPIFYVQSNNVRRDPFAFTGFAKQSIVNAIRTRYKLMPYYYTVLNKNEPLLRAMYYDFYYIQDAFLIDEQYMVGEAVMVVPNFDGSQSSVGAYMPLNQTWYDLWGGFKIPDSDSGWMEIPTSETDVAMFLRAGYIIPVQETLLLNALDTRSNSSYTLLVGLKYAEEDKSQYSSGSLYLKNKTSIHFESSEKEFNVTNILASKIYLCDDKISSSIIDRVKVYGLEHKNNNMDNYYVANDLNIDLCQTAEDQYTHVYVFK